MFVLCCIIHCNVSFLGGLDVMVLCYCVSNVKCCAMLINFSPLCMTLRISHDKIEMGLYPV